MNIQKYKIINQSILRQELEVTRLNEKCYLYKLNLQFIIIISYLPNYLQFSRNIAKLEVLGNLRESLQFMTSLWSNVSTSLASK